MAPSRSTRRLPRRSQGQVPPASLNDKGNLSIAACVVNGPAFFVASSGGCRIPDVQDNQGGAAVTRRACEVAGFHERVADDALVI